jgi:mannose-1-phosphate guanylyltransferase
MIGRRRSTAWGVLLAGGDGTRLQSLTTRIEGDTRPKQFCRMLGDETLVTQTRRRISPLFDSDKMITIVTKQHKEFYSRELFAKHEDGRGKRYACPTIRRLYLIAQDNSDSIVLLGAEATYPETEYGWIEPVPAFPNGVSFAPARVRHFWEKPTHATAQELLRRGCLWNTFVTIGRVTAFIDMLCHAAANPMLRLAAGIIEDDLDSVYRSIPPIDFSRDVLASRPERLLVIRDAVSGWTDLGNPKRVFDTLARERIAPAWLESIPGVETSVAS